MMRSFSYAPRSKRLRLKRAPDQTRLRTGSRIWVVVDGDAAYVRSVRAARRRWYREATAYPEAVLYAGARKLPVHLEPVNDEATIAHVSDAVLRKYVQWPNDARAMVRNEVLRTTLRLHPTEAP